MGQRHVLSTDLGIHFPSLNVSPTIGYMELGKLLLLSLLRFSLLQTGDNVNSWDHYKD